jgi:hypothetical protein
MNQLIWLESFEVALNDDATGLCLFIQDKHSGGQMQLALTSRAVDVLGAALREIGATMATTPEVAGSRPISGSPTQMRVAIGSTRSEVSVGSGPAGGVVLRCSTVGETGAKWHALSQAQATELRDSLTALLMRH